MIHTRTCAAGLAVGTVLFTCAFGAQAQLSYQSSSDVGGSLRYYNKSDMGDTSVITFPVPSDSVMGNGLASVDFTLPAQAPGVPSYLAPQWFTSNGQFGFTFNAQAKVTGTQLQGSVFSQVLDANGKPTSATQYTQLASTSYSRFGEQWLINADANHAAGTYGAVVIGIHLDAHVTPNLPSGYTSATLDAKSSFSDPVLSPGGEHADYADVLWSSSDTSWTGGKTVYQKLLFQYGTPLYFSMSLQGSGGDHSDAEFAGRIDSVELPYGTTLLTGAQQSGRAGVDYGTVFNAASLNDQNTNWDFVNNGGGFTPAVPEPATYALLIGGLAVIGAMKRPQRAS